jgi:leucyl-tRNA synthetase
MAYGKGAIMAVPAHDERDFDFAVRHKIRAPVVIAPPDWNDAPLDAAYTEPGIMVNSGPWNGLRSEETKTRIAEWMEERGIGKRTVQYRMRDWLISRQRYWGAPIPIVYCTRCGTVPIPEHDLPVLLPQIKAWQPSEDGRSPLSNVPEFVHATCPQCAGPAKRETDTMDGFACSSWYFLRFVSPHYDKGPFDPAALAQWGPPDLYVGGAEHAVMHLLYARFWTKVMADAAIIPFREPFPRLRSQGVMHARDPETEEATRMSKSKGNVVTPDSVAETHGADSLRVYLLFMAPFENNTVWEEEGITGARRFLERTWRLLAAAIASANEQDCPNGRLTNQLHQTIRRVTADIEAFKFNTAIATLMELLNAMSAYHHTRGNTTELTKVARVYIKMLAPFAPHIAEELWAQMKEPYSIHLQPWPEWDEALAADETITLVVQIDGKVRARIQAPADINKKTAQAIALSDKNIQRHVKNLDVQKIIYVPGRLINIVTT